MMRSFCLVLSLTVAVLFTPQVHASCNSNTCATQLGLNSSFPINSCYDPVPNECSTEATLRGCNTTLPTTSRYFVLCTATGLKFYSSDNSQCAENKTDLTTNLCSRSLFNCSDDLLTAMATTALIRRAVNNCTTPSTTPATGLKLLPNPVGPEAITAIVVLVCLFITVILAGFFFWPKCHIANPAAYAVKTATKPAAAKTAASSTASGATGGRVVYEPERKTAHITLPTLPGPSAA